MAFIRLKIFPPSPSLLRFFGLEWILDFIHIFPISIELIIWFFFFSPYNGDYMIGLLNIKPALHSCDKPHLAMV